MRNGQGIGVLLASGIEILEMNMASAYFVGGEVIGFFRLISLAGFINVFFPSVAV